MLRTALTRQARLFTTTARTQKGVVDAGKDALKKVDRTVSDVAVKGIETGGASCFANPPLPIHSLFPLFHDLFHVLRKL
jgi:hypothetical protein